MFDLLYFHCNTELPTCVGSSTPIFSILILGAVLFTCSYKGEESQQNDSKISECTLLHLKTIVFCIDDICTSLHRRKCLPLLEHTYNPLDKPKLWVALHIMWYLWIRGALWSPILICSPVLQYETNGKNKEISSLHNCLPFRLGFLSRVP